MTFNLEISKHNKRHFTEYLKSLHDQIQARLDAATTEQELSAIIAEIVLEVSSNTESPVKTGELQ